MVSTLYPASFRKSCIQFYCLLLQSALLTQHPLNEGAQRNISRLRSSCSVSAFNMRPAAPRERPFPTDIAV